MTLVELVINLPFFKKKKTKCTQTLKYLHFLGHPLLFYNQPKYIRKYTKEEYMIMRKAAHYRSNLAMWSKDRHVLHYP